MNIAFHVRPAQSTDANVLARLRYEFRSTLGDAVEDRDGFIERATVWLTDRLSSDRWRAWLVESDDGAVVGHCFLQIVEKLPNPVEEAEWIGYVTNVYVAPAHRRLGCATRLLDAALEHCRIHGAYSIILWPTDESRAMYERRGFVVPNRLMEMSCSTNMHFIPPISTEHRAV
ncbi:MAG: GNAT family N-acetyltransferase [Chloroflexi bacterium]|nr:GNAT family N-acetyltransferase [Chloroflexota bacterium]